MTEQQTFDALLTIAVLCVVTFAAGCAALVFGVLYRKVADRVELSQARWAPDVGLVEDAEVALLESWWELPHGEVPR